MIHEAKKGRDISVMVWAAFWGAGQSELYGLERDFEAVMVPDLVDLSRQSRAALGNHVQRYWLGAPLNIK